ncbi:MAG: hypothetical protein Q4C78_04660 [Synergistaceae bacterium]|nr:hypothetical protein [Synergistaceae bacterium]
MKKLVLWKNQWHIIIIIFATLLLSLLSWLRLAKYVGVFFIKSFHGSESRIVKVYSPQIGTGNFGLMNSIADIKNDIRVCWSVYKSLELSSADSLITYLTVGEITSVQVILGKSGWLFYCSKIDGDSIADFEGTNRFSQDEITKIVVASLSVQENMKNKGRKFVIFIAPNKENLYVEYMPEVYKHSEISSTDILINHLLSSGVNVVSPKADLLLNRHNKQLYYSTDMHWNQLGAYIGVKNTLQTWGIFLPDLAERKIIAKARGAGDLARMLGLSFLFHNEVEYTVDGTSTKMGGKKFEIEQDKGKLGHFHNDKAPTKGKLLIVGDSFRISMLPSLREQFSDVYVAHRAHFKVDTFNKINPDYVIAEYVERYSREIKNINTLFNK